jgi:uncharacterized repeat protein (TIGR03803 family)
VKANLRISFILINVTMIFGCIMAHRVTAQSFDTIYTFAGNGDGASPHAGLIISGDTLYSTTEQAYFSEDVGFEGGGAVFRVSTRGAAFNDVVGFAGYPILEGGVTLLGNTLYGTTQQGGTGSGTVFAVNTSGSGFTNLHIFTAGSGFPSINSDGGSPSSSLILAGNVLYGTAELGGTNGCGVVFAISIDGSGFTNMHNFSKNTDGCNPQGSLILLGDTLYGTTSEGGGNHSGTVFAIKTNGSGFTNVYSFSALSQGNSGTNGDGANPQCSLMLSGNILYGTTLNGGTSGNGAIFAINTDGTGFTNLHSFSPGRDIFHNIVANSDGGFPYAGLILSGNTLYGTATSGGPAAVGTVFAIKTDGSGFTNLYSFTGGSDGANPYASLVFCGNSLFGTAQNGGASNLGTVFKLSLPAPQLTITASGTNVVLTWPTNVAGFDYTGYTLQCATDLSSPSWNAVSPPPVIVNGLETVTNAISGTQMFYRLTQ